jgi:hypothetical protein
MQQLLFSIEPRDGQDSETKFLSFRLMYMYLNYGVIAEVTHLKERNVI